MEAVEREPIRRFERTRSDYMGNRADFRQAWKSHRDSVVRIRRDHDRVMAGLKGYEGSKAGDAKIQAETERFNSELGAARSKYGTEVNDVLKSMGDRARGMRETVVPPTPEMLAVLQAVSYRQSLSMKEYQSYLASCGGSNVAQNALWDMARHKVEGGESLQEPQSDGMKAVGVLEELRLSAKALMDWDGSGSVAVNDLASKAGEIDPTASDFEHRVVGLKYDDDLMAQLD